jgi:hypothetical protein
LLFGRVSDCDIDFFFNTLRRYPSLGTLVHSIKLSCWSATDTETYLRHIDLLPNVKQLEGFAWWIESDKEPQLPIRRQRLTSLQISALDPEFFPEATLADIFDLSRLSALAVRPAQFVPVPKNGTFRPLDWVDLSLFKQIPSSLSRLYIEGILGEALPDLEDVLRKFTALEELTLAVDELDMSQIGPLAVLQNLRSLTVTSGFNLDSLLDGLVDGHRSLFKLKVAASEGEDDFSNGANGVQNDVGQGHELHRLALAVVAARNRDLLPSLHYITLDRDYGRVDFGRRASMPTLRTMVRTLRDVGLVVEDGLGQQWQNAWFDE